MEFTSGLGTILTLDALLRVNGSERTEQQTTLQTTKRTSVVVISSVSHHVVDVGKSVAEEVILLVVTLVAMGVVELKEIVPSVLTTFAPMLTPIHQHHHQLVYKNHVVKMVIVS